MVRSISEVVAYITIVRNEVGNLLIKISITKKVVYPFLTYLETLEDKNEVGWLRIPFSQVTSTGFTNAVLKVST